MSNNNNNKKPLPIIEEVKEVQTSRKYPVDLILSQAFHPRIAIDIENNKDMVKDLCYGLINPKDPTSNARTVMLWKLLASYIANSYTITEGEITSRILELEATNNTYKYGRRESDILVNQILEANLLSDDKIAEIKDNIKNMCFISYEANLRVKNLTPIAHHEELLKFEYVEDAVFSKHITEGDLFSDFDKNMEIYNNPLASSFDFINGLVPGAKGYLRKQLIVVAASPGVGKSLVLQTEACSFMKQGEDVVYLAIGDLSAIDFQIRLSQIYLDKCPSFDLDTDQFNANRKEIFNEFKKEVQNNPHIGKLYPFYLDAGMVTAITIGKMIEEQIKKYPTRKIFMVDYDGNVKTSSTGGKGNMYVNSGELYEILATLKIKYNVLIFVASQIAKSGNGGKNDGWKNENVGLDALAESARKSAIVDFMIGIGCCNDIKNPKNNFFTLNVGKNRRGSVGKTKLFRSWSMKLTDIACDTYNIVNNEALLKSTTDLYDQLKKYDVPRYDMLSRTAKMIALLPKNKEIPF